ncbi:MAG TPA: glycosyltransferase family 2 protein, partial [Longimicrobium sp.]|nr:glycosyltransferase family 2 protein [Longimicrobium sp.]
MIYICIPVLNEAQTVGVLLWRTRQVMAEFGRDYHIVVVDDGSTDASAEVLQPYTRVLPLTVVRHERNRGYAAALETLVREVATLSTHPKRDVAVFLQADFTEPPEEIPALVKRLEGGADIVGSAVAAVEGEVTRGMRWSRRGLPWLLKRSALPREIRDPFSGFRGYRVQVLRRALSEADGKPLLERAGWAANAELLVRVAPHSRRAEEAEVRLRYSHRERETRFRPWDALRETWALFRATPGISTLRRGDAEAPAAAEPAPAAAEAPARPARREERSAGSPLERESRTEREGRPPRDERPARPRRERRPAEEAGAEAA